MVKILHSMFVSLLISTLTFCFSFDAINHEKPVIRGILAILMDIRARAHVCVWSLVCMVGVIIVYVDTVFMDILFYA